MRGVPHTFQNLVRSYAKDHRAEKRQHTGLVAPLSTRLALL